MPPIVLLCRYAVDIISDHLIEKLDSFDLIDDEALKAVAASNFFEVHPVDVILTPLREDFCKFIIYKIPNFHNILSARITRRARDFCFPHSLATITL